ncbi:MAG: GNAT family N-acetyltransferase [Halolamina sp.]
MNRSNRVTIRRYEPGDKNAVWRVHDRALWSAWDAFDPEYNRYLRHIEREFLDAGGEFLVGDVASTDEPPPGNQSGVVAIGGFQPLATQVHSLTDLSLVAIHYAPEQVVRVRSVAVDPGWQGRGAGTDLMRELERRAANAYDLVVLQSPAALPETHRFYESLGYERIPGEEDTEYVWFRRSL